LSHRYRVVS
jgi:hypothetical protein